MSSSIGMGVMIQALWGPGDGGEHVSEAIGKTITFVEMNDDALRIAFTDGTGIQFTDEGQSCCETRYMHTDDDLQYFVGSTLVGAEIRDAPDIEDGGEAHEVQFLAIKTSKGDFVIETHNEHNGWYGGFAVAVSPYSREVA